jgi:hypothetical protein
VYEAPLSTNAITIRDLMDENYNYIHSAHFQSYAYEDKRTPFHDETLAKAGFSLLKSNRRNIVYQHYKGNIYWGIAGSSSVSDYLTGANLYISTSPKGNYDTYSNTIEDIYMYPVDRLYISAHSLGGSLAKELLRKYPNDQYKRYASGANLQLCGGMLKTALWPQRSSSHYPLHTNKPWWRWRRAVWGSRFALL